MRIFYLPSDMDAPGFYRCFSPGRQLKEHGHQVLIPKPELILDTPERRQFNFTVNLNPPVEADLWVLQSRRERMWAEGGIVSLIQSGAAVVADVDDNYEELPTWNPAWLGTHPYRKDDGTILNRKERRKISKAMGWKAAPPNSANREHMNRIFELADAMTVSTPYLKQLYSKFNDNIHVVRNYVDWDIWERVKPQYKVEGRRLRIGYLGVFKYRRGDLSVIRDVIRPVMLRHPEVDFVANHEDVHDYLDIPKEQRITIGEYEFFPRDASKYPVGEMTAQCDIGLVPLLMGGMNEGKSHLKGMEYNAAGIPFIASGTESYFDYWCDMRNGYIAQSESDWTNFLELFIENDAHRRKMGAYGRRKAKRHSIQTNWYHWEDAYQAVLGDPYERLARGAIKRGAVQKVSELSGLLAAASEIALDTVVEVGSARGGTFWALAQIAADDAHLASIDIPAGSPIDVRDGKDVYTGRDRERFHEFAKPGQQVTLIDASSQLLETRVKLQGALGGRMIDMLFIDADHRYEGVKRDYELYSPLVREGGIIAFHDIIRQNDQRSGVHTLWAELCKTEETIELLGEETWGWGSWAGIGIIRKQASLVAV